MQLRQLSQPEHNIEILQQTTDTDTTTTTFEWNTTADGLLLPLTATVYYDYVEAFLLGVDFDAYF